MCSYTRKTRGKLVSCFFGSQDFSKVKGRINMMITQYDEKEGYCKMLGHFLTFDYCRSVSNGLPCSKVLDCWFQDFPIQAFIDQNYTTEEQQKIFAPQKPKILSLSEILEQAQKRLKENKD